MLFFVKHKTGWNHLGIGKRKTSSETEVWGISMFKLSKTQRQGKTSKRDWKNFWTETLSCKVYVWWGGGWNVKYSSSIKAKIKTDMAVFSQEILWVCVHAHSRETYTVTLMRCPLGDGNMHNF